MRENTVKKTEAKKIDLDSVVLLSGGHSTRENGMCAMELVAYLAGEPHSDRPKCASLVISAFVRRWNDDLDDAGRQMLKPYLPRLIGTAGTKEQEAARVWLTVDWMVRVHTPAWLKLGGMKEQADALRALPALSSSASAKNATSAIVKAKTKAAAARAAAWDAARAAAGDAARAAARAAAGKKLAPTVASLQESALALLDAMVRVTE